jgi:hypothetical protein
MLKIRKEQREALGKVMLDQFAGEMVGHLRKFFPAQCDSLGEAGLDEFIQYGISRAASYEIKKHRDICRFVDMMFVFGRDFDTNPKVPWASRILNDPAIVDPDTRIDRLYEEARRVQL